MRLSTDISQVTTTIDVQDVMLQVREEKQPKELVPATTPDSVYKTLSIKLTDEVITTHPVQETQSVNDIPVIGVSDMRNNQHLFQQFHNQ